MLYVMFAKVVQSNCTTMCGMMRWDGQPGNHTFQPLSKRGVSPCWPRCANARRNRCQEDLNSCTVGELEETTSRL